MKLPMLQDKAGQWHKPGYLFPDRGTLMPFQKEGAAWLAGRRKSILADDMGLGKTCQAIDRINRLDPTSTRVLIICPAGLRTNWLRELAKWLNPPRRCIVPKRYIPDLPVVILSYDSLTKFEVQLRRVSWTLIICDEAHLMKNSMTRRARQVLGDEFTTPIWGDNKIAMTGTPMPNRPIEIWPLLRFVGAGISRKAFGEYFCGGKNFMGNSHPNELRALLSQWMLRRRKEKILTELPPKRRQIIRLEASAAIKRVIAEEGRFDEQVAGVRPYKGKVRMRDLTHLRMATAALKMQLPVMADLIREAVESSGKVVIFGQHHATLDQAEKIVRETIGAECVTYTGWNTMDERQRAVDRFQRDPACRVFLGTIGAAGVGITLTAAAHVIFLEEDFTPGVIDQAEDRCWRYGQVNSVLCQHIVIDGSYDARQLEIQIRKQAVISAVL